MEKSISDVEMAFETFKELVEQKLLKFRSHLELKKNEKKALLCQIQKSKEDCHVKDNNYNEMNKKLHEILDICKQCCNLLRINNTQDDINIEEDPIYIPRDDCCCDQFYKITNLYIQIKHLTTYVELNLTIEEYESSNGTTLYSIGGNKDITLFKAEQIEKKVLKQLEKANSLLDESEKLYKSVRELYEQKMQERRVLNEKIRSSKAEIKHLESKINDLTTLLKQNQTTFDNIKSLSEKLKTSISDKKNKMHQITGDLNSKMNELEKVNKMLEKLEAESESVMMSMINSAGKCVTSAVTAFMDFNVANVVDLGMNIYNLGKSIYYKNCTLDEKIEIMRKKKGKLENEIFCLNGDKSDQSDQTEQNAMNSKLNTDIDKFMSKIKLNQKQVERIC
jgi:DNA repair exonuclease SbcCD ATPase subunit